MFFLPAADRVSCSRALRLADPFGSSKFPLALFNASLGKVQQAANHRCTGARCTKCPLSKADSF